jgi:hypothetical protein
MIARVNLTRALRLALVGVFAGFLIGPAAVAQAATADLLLPDLAMVAPFDFRVEITPEGRRLLRFSTVLVNIGRGPFQAYGYDTDGFAAIGDTLHVRQEIKRADGTWAVRDTGATMTWAGDGHDHWHINRYQQFALHRLDGSHIGYVAKIGFCAFDSYPYGSLKPAKYTWETYACRTAPNGRVPMGTSRNWGDIYKSTIAFQWIDITGLPAGTYRLNVVADPPFGTNGKFREMDETNNRSWARISISGSTVKVLAKSANP